MAIKELRKTWSDCQLDYVREFIATKESDVDKLPTCCVGSTCVVSETNNRYVCGKGNKWKLREKAMEEGDAVVKSINGVPPDENGEIVFDEPYKVLFNDFTMYGMGLRCNKTIEELSDILDDSVHHAVVIELSFAPDPAVPETHIIRASEVTWVKDSSKNKIHTIKFGDKYAPVIVDTTNNTLTLDPDWVKPASGGGGGIKTAIFKQGGLDGLLAGETVDYTTSLFCKNMTRDEAIQTIMSGEPLDVIYITYEGAEDSISSIGVRRINDCINYNILKDRLYVDNGAIWMEDGELAWPAE